MDKLILEVEELIKNVDIKNLDNNKIYKICCKHKELPLGKRNWEQLNTLLGSPKLNGEALRTWIKSEQKSRGELKSTDIKFIERIEELELKKIEIQKERIKLQSTKIENLRKDRQDTRFELFYENFKSSLDKLPLPENYKKIIPKVLDKEYVLTLADIHAGAKFEGINNSYSLKIMHERFNILYNYMREFVQNKKISKLNIVELGDEVQGILRINDLKLNEVAVMEAVVIVSREIANFLNQLSTHCYIDFYICGKSNHNQMRLLGSKANELSGEDLGKIITSYIGDLLRDNKNIEVILNGDKDYVEFNIFDFNCVALHGHNINNIGTLSKDISNQHRKFFDYCFVGHTHSSKEIINAEGDNHNIETLVAPSFIGSCPFADKLMVGSKASCKVFGFHPKYGHTSSHTIILN